MTEEIAVGESDGFSRSSVIAIWAGFSLAATVAGFLWFRHGPAVFTDALAAAWSCM